MENMDKAMLKVIGYQRTPITADLNFRKIMDARDKIRASFKIKNIFVSVDEFKDYIVFTVYKVGRPKSCNRDTRLVTASKRQCNSNVLPECNTDGHPTEY
jgi:hypothetical protein